MGLADAGGRFGGNVRGGVVVEHQHQQEVHLHRGQQPGGRMAPGTLFQKIEQNFYSGFKSDPDFLLEHFFDAASGVLTREAPSGPKDPQVQP